jgi:hypothetical protein
MQQGTTQEAAAMRVPEARYAYYRRCQVFRKNGEQCKAPAETGSQICHAHASQLAMAVRRERERRAVLTEAVAEMRKRGRPECEMADLFTDFKGIQMTTAVMARAVITGRIDCKTAGQMVVHLQTMSKLLWVYHRVHRGTQREKALTTKDTKKHERLPQICADERGSSKPKEMMRLPVAVPKNVSARHPDWPSAKVLPFAAMALGDGSRAHGPPDLKAA